MNPDPLAGLRPYHLPEPISWWPPAPGWWLLAALLMALAAALLLLRRRRTGREQPARLAARELDGLRTVWRAEGDDAAFMRGLSQLLRRFLLARFPGEPVAGLCGETWLRFLAEKAAETSFTDGIGRRLADAPYRRQARIDADALAELAACLIANVHGKAPPSKVKPLFHRNVHGKAPPRKLKPLFHRKVGKSGAEAGS
jgi:hypothetical protein